MTATTIKQSQEIEAAVNAVVAAAAVSEKARIAAARTAAAAESAAYEAAVALAKLRNATRAAVTVMETPE